MRHVQQVQYMICDQRKLPAPFIPYLDHVSPCNITNLPVMNVDANHGGFKVIIGKAHDQHSSLDRREPPHSHVTWHSIIPNVPLEPVLLYFCV